jgi:hypothetical protein
MMADKPNASNVVCTIQPLIKPAVVAKPLLLPFIKDWVSTYILSGPGLKAKTQVANTNEKRDSNII